VTPDLDPQQVPDLVSSNVRRPALAVGVGIDLVEVDRIQALLEKNGDRFKQRVYTAGEIAYCDSCAESAMHYAARFAAKEAVAKALGTGFAEGVSWADIEVLRGGSGAPTVALHGGAARVAAQAGVTRVLLSLTHTRTTAGASALLLSDI
jgi:holo-[acyl-carrier protein] synthase